MNHLGKRCKTLPLFLLLLHALGACGAPPSPGGTGPFSNLGELETHLAATYDARGADALWQRIRASGPLPLVFGDTAVFFYRGNAGTVEWRGDLNGWGSDPKAQGERVSGTDIWYRGFEVLPDSRFDYKIVLDGRTWLLDPLNPHRQAGGSGENSEARIPDWAPSALAIRHDDAPRGQLSDDLVLVSERLGYPVKYRVYVPPGTAPETSGLPSIYVTDGPDYYRDDWGAMVAVLDNLLAQRTIEPVIAVFISQWDLEDTVNRRGDELVPEGPGDCDFCEFIVKELAPAVESRYPVSAAGRDRAILGTSLGGLFASYVALWHSEDFGRAAIQSPAYQYEPGRFIFEAMMSAEALPQQIFLNVGLYEKGFLGPTAELAGRLRRQGTDLLYIEARDGHSWGHWRTTIDDALVFFYGKTE